jgi:hypothetical protein
LSNGKKDLLVLLKIEERKAIDQAFLEKFGIFSVIPHFQFFWLCAQYLRDRASLDERCFYLVGHDGHSDLFSHDEYMRQQDEQATTAGKTGQAASGPPDLTVAHDFLPSPTLDFSYPQMLTPPSIVSSTPQDVFYKQVDQK